MKKRILCAALIMIMAASAVGCGQSEADYTAMAENGAVTKDVTAGAVYDGAMSGAAASHADEAEYSFDGEYAEEADYMMADTLKGADDLGSVDAAVNGMGAASVDVPEEPDTEIDIPEAGQLTAGEWSDNENWGFFKNLVNSGTISYPSFGINPTNRTAVTVKNKDGAAVVNAKARLLDKSGNVLWSGVTDKQGVVYLFSQGDVNAASVEIESGGKKQSFDVESPKSNGQNDKNAAGVDMEVTFDGTDKLYKSTDIMFIVDTTGSMDDEMLFLQSEFTAITKAIGTKDTRYAVNFYRDEGDDYVTKCSDFTSNVDDLQKKLNSESADGGGDYPEAVAEILQESIVKTNWNEESVKIAFLIFDAPPHSDKDKELLEAAQTAAEKGIRIVPIVASDGDRDTELFARALAIVSGGDYVFLTDDSGIGNSHEEPIIGSYEVRKLYDIIIDIINDYKQ